jgi:hypothetical protein
MIPPPPALTAFMAAHPAPTEADWHAWIKHHPEDAGELVAALLWWRRLKNPTGKAWPKACPVALRRPLMQLLGCLPRSP